MDFALRRQRLKLTHVIAPTGQPVMSPLKRQPAPAACSPHAVTNAILLRGGMVGVDHGGHPWQGRAAQLAQEAIHVGGDAVEVEVCVDLTEVGCLNISPAKIRFRERHLVHAPTAPSRLEQEVTLLVRLCVANPCGSNSTVPRVRLVHLPPVPHAHIPSPEATAPFAFWIEAPQRLDARGHASTRRARRIRDPDVNAPARHGFRRAFITEPRIHSLHWYMSSVAALVIEAGTGDSRSRAFNLPRSRSLAVTQGNPVAVCASFTASGLMVTTPEMATGLIPQLRSTRTPAAAASGSPAAKIQASTV